MSFERANSVLTAEEISALKKLFPAVITITQSDLVEFEEKRIDADLPKASSAFSHYLAKEAFADKAQKQGTEEDGNETYVVFADYVETENEPLVLVTRRKLCLGDKKPNGELEKRIYTDVLTGALNRRYYEEKLRDDKTPSGIAIIDLDNFKIYNDLFGHAAGDLVLLSLVRKINEHIGKNDCLIRYGGDEFLLVMPKVKKADFRRKLKEILDIVRETEIEGYAAIKHSVSIGAVITKGESVSEGVSRADRLMYIAKRKKNILVVEGEAKVEKDEKPLVLIVDDSEFNREILSSILQSDYDIIEASSADECIALLKKHGLSIALTLLDIIMPEKDGFDVLEYMRYNDLIEDIPVITITGDDSEKTMRRAYEAGVVDYIMRPFDAKIVYMRVSNTINMYEKQKRLFNALSKEIKDRDRNKKMLIEILGEIVEFHNVTGGVHVRRIEEITKLFLEGLVTKTSAYGLTNRDIFLISTASSLHDIGKIAIDEKIINKAGKLSSNEFEKMKLHTIYGAEMIKNNASYEKETLLRYAYEICRWHHERFDGNGYPDGLVGDDIPISAQVVSICDVYDALVSKRPYKDAISHEKSVAMIKNGECGQFNPLLVECLDEIADKLEELSSKNLGGGEES